MTLSILNVKGLIFTQMLVGELFERQKRYRAEGNLLGRVLQL